MNIIVCGGRTIGRVDPNLTGKAASQEMKRASAERKFVMDYLTSLHSEAPFTLLITAEESVIASISLNWAAINKVPTMAWRRSKFPKSSLVNLMTSFVKKERSADYVMESFEARNARMLAGSQADMVLAFGGGNTTRLLVEAARIKGISVVEVEVPAYLETLFGTRDHNSFAANYQGRAWDQHGTLTR